MGDGKRAWWNNWWHKALAFAVAVWLVFFIPGAFAVPYPIAATFVPAGVLLLLIYVALATSNPDR